MEWFCVFVLLFLSVFSTPVRGQCDKFSEKVTGGAGRIKSPNLDSGGEYGKSANCRWEFKPSRKGGEYALVLNVTQLRLYVANYGKVCIGSYKLTVNNDPIKCDRSVHHRRQSTPANYFCKAYYRSPECTAIAKIQACETKQQTIFPVPVTYVSHGRKYRHVNNAQMYFEIQYEFIECQKETTVSEDTTALKTSTSKLATTAEVKDPTAATKISPHEERTTTNNISPTSVSYTTIILISVIPFLVIIIGFGVAGFLCRRLKVRSANTTEPPRGVGLQEVDNGVYDNDPLPLEDRLDANQQQPSTTRPSTDAKQPPANEPPDHGYELYHNYEEIKAQRPPIAPPPSFIEKPWYATTKPTGERGPYEVPMTSQPGNSKPKIEEVKYNDVDQIRRYENLGTSADDVAYYVIHKPQESNQLYATPFENKMKDPHYIDPPRMPPQEELKRFRTKFPEKKGASLPTNSDGYVEFDRSPFP